MRDRRRQLETSPTLNTVKLALVACVTVYEALVEPPTFLYSRVSTNQLILFPV